MLACGRSIEASTVGFFVSTKSISFADSGGDQATISYNSNTGSFTQFLSGDSTASGSSILGLTSSFDQTAATDLLLPTHSASSYAAADLSTGTLKALSIGTSGAQLAGFGGEGDSTAEFFDTLTFHVAGANAFTTTNIGINDSFDGINANSGVTNQISDVLVFGSGNAVFTYQSSSVPQLTLTQLGWASESFVTATLQNFLFQGVLSGQGATFVDTIDLKLDVACTGETCDYSHTGSVTLNLPSNVTVTSASGVFLSAQQSGVPEPASWAMTVAGLIVAAGLAVKRRRSVL